MIDRVRLRVLFQRFDWAFVAAMLALVVVGLLFIFSASYRSEDAPLSAMTQRQFVWGIVGVLCFTAVAYLDYHRWNDAAWWAYAACGVLLLLVLLHLGPKRYGAYRWLTVFGIQVQTSEFMKLGVLFALARFLSQPSRDVTDPRCLVQVLAIVGLPFVMVFKQPDLGTPPGGLSCTITSGSGSWCSSTRAGTRWTRDGTRFSRRSRWDREGFREKAI
jgi:cell division protein FtsW (lipid II flippase)